ncbi:hypothetical protein FO519_008097 [Halicephalobus sp. NKZ332]|nr:hypothetical protein FO519_008097 [Halicephalobus sp. NKZ332]
MESKEDGKLVFKNYTRFVIMFLSIICLTLICANSLALNFSVICMYKNPEKDYSKSTGEYSERYSNSTVVEESEMMFNLMEKSWLFSAVAIGQILGTIPITYVTSNFGVRKSFTVYGLISAVSTLLIPFLTHFGFFPIFVMRVLEGFAMATSFPSLGAIVSEWSTTKSNGMSIALLSVHLQFGSMLTMPVSGEFCASKFGWPGIYYLQGSLTLFFFIVFYAFYRDSPHIHKNVSAKELRKISTGKIQFYENGKKTVQKVPYGRILKDISVWGVFISCFGGSFGFQLMGQFGPTFLNKVLKFDVQKTGFVAAYPYLVSAIFKIVAGPFSDRFTLISEKARIIMFNSLAQFPMAACFILMAVLPVEKAGYVQTAYTLATAFCGLNAVGVAKSVQMIGQQHCHFILAMNTFIISTVQLILPPIVSFIAPDNSPEQWGIMFYGVAAIVFVTAIIFNLTAEASPRPWTALEGSYSPSKSSIPSELKVEIFSTEKITPKDPEKKVPVKFEV